MALSNECGQRPALHLRSRIHQGGIVAVQHAVRRQRLCQVLCLVSQEYGLELDAETVGELATQRE